jgi:hypothetical protein
MALGRQRKDWLRENQVADEPAMPSLHDLLKLLADPNAGIADLVAASAKHAAAAKTAQTERRKADDAIARLAEEKAKHGAEIAADRDRHEKQCRAREVALDAREKRIAEREEQTRADSEKAAEIRAHYERRQQAWDAA